MRYKVLFSLFLSLVAGSTLANWQKINTVDYIWGPFKIYSITLFSETGEYQPNLRPLMLTLKYEKPVDGRDFAISLARSWGNLGIKLPEQNSAIDRLKKILPDLKSSDSLSYIALADRGYFVLNDTIIPEEFNRDLNDAILATWLDPKVDLSSKLTEKQAQTATANQAVEVQAVEMIEKTAEQAVEKSEKIATTEAQHGIYPAPMVNEKISAEPLSQQEQQSNKPTTVTSQEKPATQAVENPAKSAVPADKPTEKKEEIRTPTKEAPTEDKDRPIIDPLLTNPVPIS